MRPEERAQGAWPVAGLGSWEGGADLEGHRWLRWCEEVDWMVRGPRPRLEGSNSSGRTLLARDHLAYLEINSGLPVSHPPVKSWGLSVVH